MQLIADFEKDWEEYLINFMKTQWRIDPDTLNDMDTALAYFNVAHRRVPPQPRQIKLSTDFFCDALASDGWRLLREKIEKGEDLSPHLSRRVLKANEGDGLLSDWGIHHFHLGTTPHPKDANFMSQGDILMFGIPKPDIFYAIGTYRHREWHCSSIIDRVFQSWPELLDSHGTQDTGSIEKHNITDEQRKVLRRRNYNLETTLPNGKVMFPQGGGVGATGLSITALRLADMERAEISSLESQILERKSIIEQSLALEGHDGKSQVTARLVFGDSPYVAFDGYLFKMPISSPSTRRG